MYAKTDSEISAQNKGSKKQNINPLEKVKNNIFAASGF